MLCSQIGRYHHPLGSWPWPLYDVFILWPLKSRQRFCTKVFGTAPGMDDSFWCFERWMFRLVPSCSIPNPTLTAVCNMEKETRFASSKCNCGTSSSWTAMPRRAKTWQSLWRHLEQLGDFGSREFQVLRVLNTSQFAFASFFWWGSWNLTRQPGCRMRTGCTCRPVKLAESCGTQKCSSFRIFSIAANCRPPFQLDCLMVAAVFTFSIQIFEVGSRQVTRLSNLCQNISQNIWQLIPPFNFLNWGSVDFFLFKKKTKKVNYSQGTPSTPLGMFLGIFTMDFLGVNRLGRYRQPISRQETRLVLGELRRYQLCRASVANSQSLTVELG